jgi:hypothetical protein
MRVDIDRRLSRHSHRWYDADSTVGSKLSMTDDERDRAIDFVIQSLAGLEVISERQEATIEKLTAGQVEAEHRLDRYERILKLIIRAGRRERGIRRDQDARYARRYRDLVDSQAHTDARLDAIVDIVRQRLNGSS